MYAPRNIRSVAVALGLALVACGSNEPNAPPDVGDPGNAVVLTLGDTADLTLAPRQWKRLHHLTVSAPTEVAIFMQGRGGDLWLSAMIDSINVSPDAFTYGAGGATLLQSRTERFVIPAGKTLSLTVNRAGGDSTTRIPYRLFAYRVNRAPEHGPATFTPGVVRNDEDLETSADIDEYALSGQGGKEFVGYLATTGPADPANFDLQFIDPAQPASSFSGVSTPSAGVPLEDNASGGFRVPASGAFVVRVTSSSIVHPQYQFLIRQLQRAPETSPATVGTETVISEALDYTGDIDEFTVHGAPGEQVNLIFESDTTTTLYSELVSFGEGVGYGRAFLGGSAFQAATGMVTVPASGNIGVRVSNSHEVGNIGRGAYRIHVVPVHPGPETAPATLTGTDSVMGESIDRWADRDEFTLTWPVASEANLFLRRDGGTGEGLRLDLLTLSGDTLRSIFFLTDTASGTGRFQLPAGTYRLRVSGAEGPFIGPYRAYVYRISEAPESSPLTLGLGAVVNEAIDPIGDRDTFNISIPAGELFQVRLTVSSVSAQGIGASYVNDGPYFPGGPAFSIAPGSVSMPSTAEPNDDRHFSVAAFSGTSGEHGAYTVRIEAVPLAPESNPTTIGIGATVTETLPAGDVDQYDLVAAPNSEFALLLRPGLPYSCADVLAPDSRTRIGVTASQQQDIGSGIITLGPTGRARIRIWTPRDCFVDEPYRTDLPYPSDYTLSVLPVNHAPEIASAAIALGDTVRNETIAHPADIDDFHFNGTAGQVVIPAFKMPYPQFSASTLRLEVIAPGGAVVGVISNQLRGDWVRGAGISLPTSGTYTLRLMTEGNREGMGSYEFTVGN